MTIRELIEELEKAAKFAGDMAPVNVRKYDRDGSPQDIRMEPIEVRGGHVFVIVRDKEI